MNVESLYNFAYNLHYSQTNLIDAFCVYSKIIDSFPDSKEAGYAKSQMQNIQSSKSFNMYDIEQINIIERADILINGDIHSKELDEERQKNIIITTTNNIDGYKVKKYITIESIEVVIGTGIFSELSSDISDMFGSRSKGFENKLQNAKTYALNAMKKKIFLNGGNAMIGTDIDYIEFTGNRVELVISGTIVELVAD